MGRSARRDDWPDQEPGLLATGAAALGGLLIRHPGFVAGATGLLVAMSYVSANALWYQPHRHAGAFFATRMLPAEEVPAAAEEPNETTIRILRPEQEPVRDPGVQQVQAVLKKLGFYEGEVDGIAGPATRRSIERYQQTMAIPVTGRIDDDLHALLDSAGTTAGILPAPREPAAAKPVPVAAPALPDNERVMRVQAALRAFGNEGIEIDGVVGSRTRAAITEFQALFGLPETGQADDTTYAKMREIGLAD